MPIRIPWDKYEAALLLEYCIKIENKEITRTEAVSTVSQILRSRAIRNGLKIDDVFRNENGITFQMASMESAYKGRTILKPATKLFAQTVSMLQENRSEYNKLLEEAMSMNKNDENTDKFTAVLPAQNTSLSDPVSLQTYCFENPQSLSFTKPVLLTYFNDTVIHAESWRQLYISFLHILFKDYPQVLMNLCKANTSPIIVADKAGISRMHTPTEFAEGLFAETNRSANNIMQNMKKIIDACNVDYENIIVKYEANTEKTDSSEIKKTSTHLGKNRMQSTDIATNTYEYALDENAFYTYLHDSAGMSDATCRSYISAIRNAEKYASEHGLDHAQLYHCSSEKAENTAKGLFGDSGFLKYNEQQHNRFRAAINRLLECMGCARLQAPQMTRLEVIKTPSRRNPNVEVLLRYEELLDKFFQKGFRMESSLDMKKLRKFYLDEYGTEISDEDDLVCQDVSSVTILYDGKAYLPDSMLSQDKKEKLLQYITDKFESGCDAIYYGALFSEFEYDLQGEHIYTPEMLKTYLSYINKGNYVLQRSYLAKDYTVQMNPEDEIREYLKEASRPVEVERLVTELSYIPKQQIKFALSTNRDFIWNKPGEYFHGDSVDFSNSELEWIDQFIDEGIEERDFLTGNELVDAVDAHFPDIKEMYPWLTRPVGMRDIIGYKLKDKFSFNGNIISRYGENLSMAEVYAKYCRKHSRFTLDELNVLKQELGSTIYFDEIYANSLRINQNEFVSQDMAQFDVEGTDEAIGRICSGQYMSLQEIRDFGTFPYAGYPWNAYLLEHFVANYSKKFMLLHIGYNANVCAGAIVKQASSFENFNDLLIDVLANSNIVLDEEPALEYLRQQGYIARRRYSDIGRILTEAKVVRSKKG